MTNSTVGNFTYSYAKCRSDRANTDSEEEKLKTALRGSLLHIDVDKLTARENKCHFVLLTMFKVTWQRQR